MYLTAILLNDEFMNSLSAEDKEHFYEAGLRAARTERVQSVADAEEIKTSKAKQQDLGIEEIIAWSDDEIEKLKDLWAPLYKQYENFFSFDILDKIKKA
jgi:TRAP-type C4-dicarboxylate transport system substrate-binding protein